jgi:hypothetical protein
MRMIVKSFVYGQTVSAKDTDPMLLTIPSLEISEKNTRCLSPIRRLRIFGNSHPFSAG